MSPTAPPPPAKATQQVVSETVAAGGPEVDREARTVRGIALSGLESRNGYTYRAEALSGAASLYEGRPVFLDHAADPNRPQSRSTRDLVGTLAGVRFDAEAGVLRGDVRVLDTESGRTFLALCEAGPENTHVGMSHVVLARRSEDGREVVAIERVVSVDAVAFPATTRSLSESSETGAPELRVVTGEDDQPGEPNSETERLLEQIGEMARERVALRERLAEAERRLEETRVRRRRDEMLLESGLPDVALTPPFRRAVREATDESQAAALIRDRRTVVEAGRGRWPHQRPRSEEPAGVASGDGRFVAAVRGR